MDKAIHKTAIKNTGTWGGKAIKNDVLTRADQWTFHQISDRP